MMITHIYSITAGILRHSDKQPIPPSDSFLMIIILMFINILITEYASPSRNTTILGSELLYRTSQFPDDDDNRDNQVMISKQFSITAGVLRHLGASSSTGQAANSPL